MASVEQAVAALRLAIQTERDGRAFYQEAAERTQDPQGRELFRRLADDEVVHERILRERLQALEAGAGWGEAGSLPASALPSEGTSIFSRERVRQDVGQYTYELSALRLAYLIEQDAVDFYTRAAEATDDPGGKAMFRQLADMERMHRRILEDEYRFLADQFKMQMGFAPF